MNESIFSPARRAAPTPTTDPSPPARLPSSAARGRGWARAARVAIGTGLGLLGAVACAEDAAPPPVASVDAGPTCERGSEGCACVFGSGCMQGLLCIAGRCLQTETEAPPETGQNQRPPLRPTLPTPVSEPPDSGLMTGPTPPDPADASSDAGGLPASAGGVVPGGVVPGDAPDASR